MKVIIVSFLVCMLSVIMVPSLGAQDDEVTTEQGIIPQDEALDAGTDQSTQVEPVNTEQGVDRQNEVINTELDPGSYDGAVNTGQDFTRPVRRIDVALAHMDMAGDAWSESFILSAGLPYTLPNGWVVSLRAEQPYSIIKGVSRNNPTGKRLNGFGEFLGEVLFIAPPEENWTYALGAQWIPPSASHDELGTGRHQLVPSAGFRYDLGQWMQGAWCGLMVRHAFDVAGYSGYDHISQTIAQPMMNIDLPDLWFLTFAPEIRYDWKNSEWFVPFDMTVGKMLTGNIVASFTLKSAINDDMLLYVNVFEGRVGYFF